MIIGTCNFNRTYNGTKVDKKEVWKILEYAQENNLIIDTAFNYGSVQKLIGEFGYEGPIITKIWKQDEFYKSLEELKVESVYCCMARENNSSTIEFLKDLKDKGLIEKTGMSVYYPEEIRSDVNIVFLPNEYELYKSRLKVIYMYADLYVRSLFNMNKNNFYKAMKDYYDFKQHERADLGHRCYPVIGVDNLDQLKRDREMFN